MTTGSGRLLSLLPFIFLFSLVAACVSIDDHGGAMGLSPADSAPTHELAQRLRQRFGGTLIVTLGEKGSLVIDDGGNHRHLGGIEAYLRQLAWYDAELQRDDYVLGFAVFNAGDSSGDWASFDVTSILSRLAELVNGKG